MYVIYLLVCLLILILFILHSMIKPRDFPPGPAWLPIVGNIPLVKDLTKKLGGQHIAFLELAKQFKTDVLGLKLGNTMVVVVFSYPLIKEVLTSGQYDARPDNFFTRLRCYGSRKGITCTEGSLWKTQRSFTTRHLSKLGFGKKVMELMISEELLEILDIISTNKQKLHIGRVLSHSVMNVLWFIVSGERIPRSDSRINRLFDLLVSRSRAFDMSGGLLGQYPFLRFVAPEKTGYNLIKQLNGEIRDFFMETINQHHDTWTEGKEDDLMYAFISEMKNSDGKITTFTDDQLLMICLDFFIAGAHTTSNTIDFALLLMLLHPELQTKVQNVLDEYYNKHNNLEYLHRYQLPYVEAVLLESERYCGVVTMIPRTVSQDTILGGYRIPKNATVLTNSHSLYVDKEIWGDPEVFRPERFLDSEGNFVPNELLIPFGLGKRRCLGEALGRHCVFLFFCEILRNFTIRPVDGSPLPSSKPLPGITASPEEYFASFIPRNVS